MSSIPQIHNLDRQAKMELLEMLWDDLTGQPELLQSPGWHESILQQRMEQVKSGLENVTDWNVAKEEIRRKIP